MHVKNITKIAETSRMQRLLPFIYYTIINQSSNPDFLSGLSIKNHSIDTASVICSAIPADSRRDIGLQGRLFLLMVPNAPWTILEQILLNVKF